MCELADSRNGTKTAEIRHVLATRVSKVMLSTTNEMSSAADQLSPAAEPETAKALVVTDVDDEEEQERRHFNEVVNAMRYYRYYALSEVARRERHLARLPEKHKAMFPSGAIEWKIESLKRAAHVNAMFMEIVTQAHKCVFVRAWPVTCGRRVSESERNGACARECAITEYFVRMQGDFMHA